MLAISFMAVVGFANAQGANDVVDVAISSKDHTTLVAAMKAAGLVETLKGEGPFTIFAPTNAAFDKLPAGTVEILLKPENKSSLAGVLTYHVVAGNIDAATLGGLIEKGDGKAKVATINGQILEAYVKDGSVYLKDSNGGKAKVTTADLKASNGVIHVTDAVSLPK